MISEERRKALESKSGVTIDGAHVVYEPQASDAEPFRFAPVTAAVMLASDNAGAGEEHQKVAMLAAATDREQDEFSRLHARDFAALSNILDLLVDVSPPTVDGEDKCDPDTVDREIERLLDARRLRADEPSMGELERARYQRGRAILRDGLQRGYLVIEDDATLVFDPVYSSIKPLRFGMPTGATFLAGDVAGQVNGTMAMLGQITGRPRREFHALNVRDYGVCTAILHLFLA